ncbi:MAG: hypothetical protein KIS76_04405 [Pyrinomonadaceae bacterium]|nr:hypothetical protein [Pyrinomonadaceae bacterium]
MRSRKIKPAKAKNNQVRREREPVSLKYVLLGGICGIILVVGLIGAARQQFASINYGIKNAKLKKQVEELKSEQRRLQLNREVAMSPAEIKRAARRIGFTEMTAQNIQTFEANREAKEEFSKTIQPKVLKTAMTLPVIERERVVKPKNTVETVKLEPVAKSKKSDPKDKM